MTSPSLARCEARQALASLLVGVKDTRRPADVHFLGALCENFQQSPFKLCEIECKFCLCTITVLRF